MTVFNSTLYTKADINKYLLDPRDRSGRIVPIPFEVTITTETTADTTNLCVLPANCEVVSMETIATVGLGTATIAIGDSGAVNRYQIALAQAVEVRGRLAGAGMRYRPAVDTIVFATYAVANPTGGGVLKGLFLIVPGI